MTKDIFMITPDENTSPILRHLAERATDVTPVENKLVLPDDGGTRERMMKWLSYEHLPLELQWIVQHYNALGVIICEGIPPGPERTVALRKLIESKDCAVRAVIEGKSPGQAKGE